MTRIMRDSTTAHDIPHTGLQLVAGYSNGMYRWSLGDWLRFPGVPHVHVDVLGTDPRGSGVRDGETGDATVATAVRWGKARRALHPGAYAVVYCNRDTLTPLFNAMDAAGLKIGADFWTWISTLDGTRTVADMTGVVAVQYEGEDLTHGHYDQSLVYDDHWHGN